LTVAALAFHGAAVGHDPAAGPTVATVSGGNVDPEAYRRYLATPLPD
jgi:hypothetical protein